MRYVDWFHVILLDMAKTFMFLTAGMFVRSFG